MIEYVFRVFDCDMKVVELGAAFLGFSSASARWHLREGATVAGGRTPLIRHPPENAKWRPAHNLLEHSHSTKENDSRLQAIVSRIITTAGPMNCALIATGKPPVHLENGQQQFE